MMVQRAYKFRLKPDSKESAAFSRFAGCSRFIWNKALSFQKERLDAGMGILSYASITAELVSWKDQFPFLKEVHSQPLQQRLKELDRALREAFSKTSPKCFPTFKKKFKCAFSFRYPQGFKISGNCMYLPKIGWVPFFKSREVQGVPKNCTVSERGGHWYVSIQTEYNVPDPIHPSSSAVGADLGTANIVALSTGDKIVPVSAYETLKDRLTLMQKRLSRMVKRSSNWKRQKHRIRNLHARIACLRQEHLHQVSSRISKNHALVVMEDLNVRNMTASARGTIENPGKAVKKKSSLNRVILDQGWYELRRQIDYKLKWKGGLMLVVPPHHTSQTCPQCGSVSPENRPTRSLFYCTTCGHTDDADVNAAKNILREGLSRLACGSNGVVMPSEAGTIHRP